MKIPINSCNGLIKVIYELLHLEEASIEVLRKHFENSAHLVNNLILFLSIFNILSITLRI